MNANFWEMKSTRSNILWMIRVNSRDSRANLLHSTFVAPRRGEHRRSYEEIDNH